MRKLIACALCLALLCAACAGSLASGVTVRAFTPFADMDFAAQAYMDLITAWEGETGNVVEDHSGLTDGVWLAELAASVSAGQADVVVLPVGTGLTAQELVTAAEIAQAAPDLGARALSCMAEADGSVLLTPVRLGWEALYVNQDVLAAAGLAVPGTFEELVAVCAALAQKGVTPIANALCEWAEPALDCAALMNAPVEQYGGEASLSGAQSALAALTVVGAFGQDPWNAADADMEAQFLSGQAAMRFDTDALAASVPAERADSVCVISLAAGGEKAVAGTPGFGLAITRACWVDDARREAALSFARALLTGEGAQALAAPAQGLLGRSIAEMTAQATACAGLLYDLSPDTFDAWAEQVVASLMSL